MHLLVPRILQDRTTDCGPACLAAALQGIDTPVSLDTLHTACAPGPTGTSIDRLETVATHHGLPATQRLLPADQIGDHLPAVTIVRLPDDVLHFVLLWRRHGPLVQLLDPVHGRLFLPWRQVLPTLHHHRQIVPGDAFDAWTETPSFRQPLHQRLEALDLPPSLLDTAPDLADLEAALRHLERLPRKAPSRRHHLDHLLDHLLAHPHHLPDADRHARRLPDGTVRLQGAVILDLEPPRPTTRRRLPRPRAFSPPVPSPTRLRPLFVRALPTLPTLLPLLCGALTTGALRALLVPLGLLALLTTPDPLPLLLAALPAVALLELLDHQLDHAAHRTGRRLENHLRTALDLPTDPPRDLHPTDQADRLHAIATLHRTVPALLDGFRAAGAALAVTITLTSLLASPLPALTLAALSLATALLPPFLIAPALARARRTEETTAALLDRRTFDGLTTPTRPSDLTPRHERLLTHRRHHATATHHLQTVTHRAGHLVALVSAVLLLPHAPTPTTGLLTAWWFLDAAHRGQAALLELLATLPTAHRLLQRLEPLISRDTIPRNTP